MTVTSIASARLIDPQRGGATPSGLSHNLDLAFSREALLAAVQAVAPNRPGQSATAALAPFLEQYRADAFADDFVALTTEDAASLALDLWDLNLRTQATTARAVVVRKAMGEKGRSLRFDVVEIAGPDMNFLVDSAINTCREARADVRAVLHPVVDGPPESHGGPRSLIQIHIATLDDAHRADLQQRLEETFEDVARVNADHGAMRARLQQAADRLAALDAGEGDAAEDVREARDFLSWLLDDKFVFLGVRDYSYARTSHGELAAEEPIAEIASGLGVLTDAARSVLSRKAEPTMITPAVGAFLDEPNPLILAKSSYRTHVHRLGHADYVGVKRHDANGDIVGETRFIGLYTSAAYTQAPSDVPLVRLKIARVMRLVDTGSRFTRRQLGAVLSTYPRDELFQISVEELARIAPAIAHLQTRPRTQLFIRRDRFDRYVSALLFVPRDSYNSDLRTRAHRILADAYGGRTSAFYPSFNEGPLVRVHLIIGLNPGHPEPDEDALDLQMRQLFETWEDALKRVARSTNADLSMASDARFTAAYKEAFAPDEGLNDLTAIAAMGTDKLNVRAWGADFNANAQQLKIYHRDSPLDLADIVPVLERMCLRVKAEMGYPVRIARHDGSAEQSIYIHNLVLDRPQGQRPLDARFEEAFEAVWARATENDVFNSLVPALGVDWRQAALLRTLARYRSQSGLDPSETVQAASLREYPDVATNLLKLFAIKFDPDMPGGMEARKQAMAPLETMIARQLESVATLDADRVLRRLFALVKACLRTNFYFRDGDRQPDRRIAIKIASPQADPLPAPRPYREIFVWSPDVEGVHLRFGPVARGGLRWSDRREDFRTEVLGLVKAQQVKNAVIVPVGAKGGFYPKTILPGAPRDEVQAKGVEAYKSFVGALLDLTDNLFDGKVERHDRMVVWDEDDPYLVVAADKGTATFSDIANGLAAEHNFWLDDAFASGGSVGYDHKKMGITARGAWVAVQRHFREMGVDVQTQPFTVIGVGDMSGDVFGNGMLMSKAIQLVAAFDHRHIFLDPDPKNLEASFNERKRMFELPRSSWADYDRKLISEGGGVFERSAKSITLTPAVKALSGLTDDAVTPDQLMHALLVAEADLLFFGGIGAFIKASTQANADVGDKTNDGLRVDGKDVKAKVIGEGANLGVTQAGRIEFARKGGRLNTDAIDNSAGVDCSDHEVNIKILLAEAIRGGALKAADRNALLASMTDEVGALVLADNYDQTEALSLMQANAAADIDSHERLIETLETKGRFSRVVEGLPAAEGFRALRERNLGLTRPELSVIMAWAKLDLFDALIKSSAPDDPTYETLLESYFPGDLKRFGEARGRHRLRREIIATRLSNRIVNLTGAAFASEKIDGEGQDPARLARAVEGAYAVFHFDELFARIRSLDGKAPAEAQVMMLAETSANLRLLAGAFLGDPAVMDQPTAGAVIARYRDRVAEMRPVLPQATSALVTSRVEARAQRYRQAGAPAAIAADVAGVRSLASARETIDIANRTGWPLSAVAFVQHQMGEQLGLDRMRAAARDLAPRDHWDRLALQRVADDLPRQQSELATFAINAAQRDGVPPTLVDRAAAQRLVQQWLSPRRELAGRLSDPTGTFDSQGGWSLAKLVLLGDAVREFVYAAGADATAKR